MSRFATREDIERFVTYDDVRDELATNRADIEKLREQLEAQAAKGTDKELVERMRDYFIQSNRLADAIKHEFVVCDSIGETFGVVPLTQGKIPDAYLPDSLVTDEKLAGMMERHEIMGEETVREVFEELGRGCLVPATEDMVEAEDEYQEVVEEDDVEPGEEGEGDDDADRAE